MKLLTFFIFIVLWGLASHRLTAQDYFNIIYRVGENNTIFTESLWNADTLYAAGTISTDEGRTGAIFKVFKNGDLTQVNRLIDTFTNYGTGFWDKGLAISKDTLYHIATKGYIGTEHNGLILKLDINGNKLDEAEFMSYYFPEDDFCRFRDFVKLNDGYLILDYGRKSETNFESCLIKTDLNFNQVWRKCYGNEYLEIPNDLIVTGESDIIILGNATNIDISDTYVGSGQGFFRGFIILFDSVGTYKGEWRSPSKKEAIYAAHVVNDSLIVIAAGAGIEICSDSQSNAVCHLNWTGKAFQFNFKTKEKNWETSMSGGDYTVMFDNRYLDIIPSIEKDGYILCGAGYYEIPDCRHDTIDKCWANPGVIAKLSNEGDSIWLRKYFGVTDIYESNILYDVEITQDSGYSFVGEAFNPWPGETQGQHGWILKTDKFGCITPGCHIISSTENGIDIPSTSGFLTFFPNPAIDEINMVINDNVSRGSKILLINAIGQTISTLNIVDSRVPYSFNNLNIKPGVYFITLINKYNSVIECKKLIVN